MNGHNAHDSIHIPLWNSLNQGNIPVGCPPFPIKVTIVIVKSSCIDVWLLLEHSHGDYRYCRKDGIFHFVSRQHYSTYSFFSYVGNFYVFQQESRYHFCITNTMVTMVVIRSFFPRGLLETVFPIHLIRGFLFPSSFFQIHRSQSHLSFTFLCIWVIFTFLYSSWIGSIYFSSS